MPEPGRDPSGETTAHLGEGGHRLSPLSPEGGRPAAHERFRRGAPLQCDGPRPRHVGFPLGQSPGRPRPDAPPGGQDREPRERDHPDQGVLPGRCGRGPDLLRLAGPVRPPRGGEPPGHGESGSDCWSSRPSGLSRPSSCGRGAGRPSSWWWWR